MKEHVLQEGPLNPRPAEKHVGSPAYIVGVGASAGGLESLEKLFSQMPAQSGMTFVVLQHLSPDFKSLTDELLARRTGIPIYAAEDGADIRPDAIYLLPPKKNMIVSGGKLLLTDKDPALLSLPIDHFFRSLAQEAGPRAIAIVLSGTGSDGSRGIRDVYDAGGLVVAQAPESAKFDGMPNSAIQSGTVHFTLPPEEIPDALMRYINHPLANGDAPARPAEPVTESAMETVFRLLRDSYEIDFSCYKPETIARRTDRRLQLNHSFNLDDYVERLSTDPEELNKLYKDLLIGVTRFFRDREAFERLETVVLPALLQKLPRNEELRLWVSACATGEEVYSLAILVQEQFHALSRPVNAKIFATDVHPASLDFASAGIYRSAELADVHPVRLAQFFVRREDDLYQVSKDIRQMVVFARHNVIRDAPFTRMDLISCRNLLIYFQPLAQKKALTLFHFGLKAGGVLVLGPSETPGELSDEFETLDGHWKFYRKRRDIRLPTDIRLTSASSAPMRAGTSLLPGPIAPLGFDGQLIGSYDALLDEYMPPSVLVGERREVLHAFGGAGRFLQHANGRVTTDLLDMVSAELRVALTGALQRVSKEHTSVVYRGLRIAQENGETFVNLTVKPVLNRRADVVHALVCLDAADATPSAAQPLQEIDGPLASSDHLLSLESELRYTKENLQATIEELETSNEELQATNEELVAANEELQSTNEELHSVNEELYTVNAEHQKKIVELTELTADMDNLLTSTDVHTVFLDADLRIRKFTPQIADTFNLLPQDVGRRIEGFTHSIDHPGLLDEIREVLRTGDSRQREVRDRKGGWFLLRILPYRAHNGVDGVVLTLIDVGALRHAEDEVRLKDRYLASILRNSPNFVFIKDLEKRYVLADDAYRRVLGCDPVGKTAHDVYPREVADRITAQDEQVLSEGASVKTEIDVPLADGVHTFLSIRFPLQDESGRIIGLSGAKMDITLLKRAEQQSREAVEQRDQFLAMLSHELRNPLAAMLNATSVIDAQELPKAAAEWFHIIERRGRHMARLLDDLLDVSRLTRNTIEINRRPLDLGETISGVLEEALPRFGENQIELTVVRPAAPLIVAGDPSRLQQIQVNLLLNAAKYTPAGGQVWYSISCEANQAVIRVRDTGRGISPTALTRVFDLFFQTDHPLDRGAGGIGVGLTLVRAIVELHGGRVEAFSEGAGLGSEFVVRLPLCSQPVGRDESSDSRELNQLPVPDSPCSILLVEDDADIRESMRALLEMDGHQVSTADTGAAALRFLQQEAPDVMLVDIGLPEMDGYQLARAVRQLGGADQPHLIALTGYGQTKDREAAREAGFDDHLTKPLRPEELYRALKDAASGRPCAGEVNGATA
ncbi:chemotaxis protein CheB [Lacipirellula limnantheis]|uniref:histidine kinase n=1 Tax=Lacipirellula limnantheis TaxID=2528024 RepID=A0A517TYQ0_9BACT|nr:chemotaxis protein CheB [Lacipirellula limnantheis]QDT73502.1 Aerobic respiration control sensor protein ArcB [Lacipirellula limnantheis]